MSDPAAADSAGPISTPTTAGGLLRQARQAQGLHIAALAAAIKVVPRKLELLEADQFDQLPDATFARALANTVCRTLKIDAAPVLALLPPLPGHRLQHVAEGLKTPFEEGQGGGGSEGSLVAGPVLWLAGILIVAALVVFFAPSSWLHWRPGARAVAASGDAASAAATDAAVAETGAAPVAATPAVAASAATEAAASADPVMPPGTEVVAPPAESEDASAVVAASASAPGVARLLEVTPNDASWVEVIDAHGKTLISRLVQADEHVQLDGATPLKIKIGNANATQVVFRGQPMDLAPYTRDNMAKLQLK